MNTTHHTPDPGPSEASLSRLRHSRLARAISLVLASLFSLQVMESEAEGSVTEADTDDLNQPSEAGAVFDPPPPPYLDLALQTVRESPTVFANRALLGSPPSTMIVSPTGAIGLQLGVHDSVTLKLAAASTTGLKVEGADTLSFSNGRIENSSITAAAAKGQTAAHAASDGTLVIRDSSLVLDPKTAAAVAITTNDLTGLRIDAHGEARLSNVEVVVGGGAKGNGNLGIQVDGGTLDMAGGSVTTQSWGAQGIVLDHNGAAQLENVAVSTAGARSTTTAGAHGILVSGASQLDADAISITTSGGSAYGLRADGESQARLNHSHIASSGGNGHGVLADRASVEFDGGSITTRGKGSVGVWALNGAQVSIGESTIRTSGAAVSAASPVDDEKTLSLSHGLLAGGSGTLIDASGLTLDTSAGSASAARAEEGARIVVSDSDIKATGSATSTTTTAALHALGGGVIEGSGNTLLASGSNVGGARAEGSGSSVSLSSGTITVQGAGSVANPAAGARAMGGGAVSLSDMALDVHGLTYGHGASVEGAGSTARVEHSTIAVDGNRSIGVNVSGGGRASVTDSSIMVDAQAGAAGPWSPGVLVTGNGSKLNLSGSQVQTTQKSSYGVQVTDEADVALANSRITTSGNYSAALAASRSTVTADGMTITTHGNDNAMGVVADLGATVSLKGGSVTTTGNGSPIPSNLTFPHGLAARNPGALLVADGTSVLTQGSQAYGAAVDDGGSMQLSNLSVKTEGQYSVGLYAGIGSAKPGAVSLSADHVTVQTLGDHAGGALVSRQHKDETATLELSNASIATQGTQSHGLRAESGALLNAANSAVSTSGSQALGVMANNTAEVQLESISVDTRGDLGHGVVAKQGGHVDASSVVVAAHGQQSAALYAQGTEALPGQVRMDRATLSNRDGATIATAGSADIALSRTLAGGSGQWLHVDSSVASDGSSIPDMGTGQWQGVGKSEGAAGNARIDLSRSIVIGSAQTAAGSHSDVTLGDTSLWQLTGDSNLSSLTNADSLIDFSADGGYKRLTTNDYHGANGTIALNTYLYKDDSPSDQLVIDGGQATGESNLRIKNADGPGALTEGNGIKVVDAVNGGTTEADAFRLLNRVKAGPYEYTLHRASLDDSNGEAWYLRSTQEAAPVDPLEPLTPDNPADPLPVDPRTPDPVPQKPNYRAETSLYSALPAMALNYSRALVDTLHERVGEERRNVTDPLPAEATQTYGPSLGWGRLIYQKGKDSLGNGADYDYRIQAFQVGADLYRHEDTDGSTDQAGLSLQAGRIKGSVDHTSGQDAGDDTLRSYGIGGYWTHFGPKGWYLDGVLQYNRFDLKARANEAGSLKSRGQGVTASLEAGYPLKLDADKTLHIEPQAQLIVSKLKLDHSHDDAADVHFDDVDSLTGRLGVRIDKDWFREDDKGKQQRTSVWVRPSVWHEFKGKARTEFSSADGYIPFGTEMDGSWGELNLGVDYQLDERTSVSGSLGYQKSFDGEGRSYEGILGIKVKF